MKAIETTGLIDDQHRLILDEPLLNIEPSHVRIIVLVPEHDDIDEKTWLHAASKNSAFDFLKDEGEDIYSALGGKPFDDKK